jgi:Zinc dependent phospholipase C
MTLVFRSIATRLATLAVCATALLLPAPARAYSVLSHEEVVDMAWKTNIVPMLKQRFPGITDDDIREAHAYAYGGSVIQDIGYYPFGSHYFSDLLHYVRPQEFVEALIRDSTTPDEYAFALGALAHFCGDTIGHPAVNLVVAQENPPLSHRFGRIVTYGEDPTAHIRTEFGFDVVEVAQGHYSQENYRDFIGFQVAKPLLDRAFQETYGIPVNSVMTHEDLAIGSYRRAVSSLIPKMTRLAFVSYKDQIQKATPGIAKNKFLYRLNQTEFKKDFGNDYYRVGFWGHIASFFLRIVPKIGPFKALKVTLPNSQEQDIYIKSVNATVDQYHLYLAQIHADPAPLPPPTPQGAADARKAAESISKDAGDAKRLAADAQDQDQKAVLEKSAVKVANTAEKATAAADRTETKVAADQASDPGGIPASANAIPAGTPIQPPATPSLPELDLDTGNPSSVGEYALADQTYAKLLDQLVKPAATKTTPSIDPQLAAAIEQFFAHPVASSAPPPSSKVAEKAAAQERQVQADIIVLKTLGPPAATGVPTQP